MRQKKMSRSEQRKFLESRLEDLRGIYRVQNVAEVPGKKGIWEIEEDDWKFYRMGEKRLVVLIQNRLVPVLYKSFNRGIDTSLPSLVVILPYKKLVYRLPFIFIIRGIVGYASPAAKCRRNKGS